MQLEFAADWGGIATGLVSAGLQYNAQRNSLKLEMAKLQAQQRLNQMAMLPPPAYPQASYSVAPTPGVGARQPSAAAYTRRASALPRWAIPAGAALLALGVLVVSRR